MNRDWISALACAISAAKWLADERAVNAGAPRDDRRLELVVAALVSDLRDHRADPLVLVAVDRALGVCHRGGPVGHAASSLCAARTEGSGVNAGGRNVGSGLRVAAICSTATVPSIRARVARSTRNSSSSLDRSPGRELVERVLAGADQRADGADLRVGGDRFLARPLRQLRHRGAQPLAGLQQPFEVGVEVGEV